LVQITVCYVCTDTLVYADMLNDFFYDNSIIGPFAAHA